MFRTKIAASAVAVGVALIALGASTAGAQVSAIKATLVAPGFSRPIGFVQDPSNAARQVVIEQGGRVRLLVNGVVQGTDFLDLSGIITPTSPSSGEQGLLGFAFAPDYATSGRVYASFTNISGHSVIARFTRSGGNPLTIDPGTRFDLVWPGGLSYIVQPFANHNGGQIGFGPDGFLYVGLGDGGGGDDTDHRAQNPATLLGKMLRIDVSVSGGDAEGYDVPAGNPFVGQGGVLAEIWAFGLRNPWRWSFDNQALGGSGALVIGDVGQISYEEIDWQPAGVGGLDYGWRNREGAHDHVTSLPPFSLPLRDPLHEYPRSEGRTVIGGYVYRGTALGAAFTGRYIFADFVDARIWSLGLSITGGEASVTGIIEHTDTIGTSQAWSSFGEGANGEIYLLAYTTGGLYRLDPVGVVPPVAPPPNTNLIQNGQFTLGDPPSHWATFATPDASYMTANLSGGVFRFYRSQAPAGTASQAVVFQQTGLQFPTGAPILASFQIGNSDSARKRISVLIHDNDFSDLSVCTFWLAANAPLASYGIRTHTTKTWSNATISFYAASANAPGNSTGYYLLDNVAIQYAPAEPVNQTNCIDPTTPAAPGGANGPELLLNGTFSSGLSSWTLFGQINGQVTGGVFEFIRPAGTPAGVILQTTSLSMTAGQRLTAGFQLGNSSGVRKRVTAILHDADFTDLAACTFWLDAGQGLETYALLTYATKAWTNATLALYPSTVGGEQWMRFDNASLVRTPSAALNGTDCVEFGSGGDQLQAPSGNGQWSNVPSPATTDAERADDVGADLMRGVRGGDARDWIADGFTRTGEQAPGAFVSSWSARSSGAGTNTYTLTHGTPIGLSGGPEARFVFQSRLSSSNGSRAVVEVSLDGIAWEAVRVIAPSDAWATVEIDLAAYAGQSIFLRFVFDTSGVQNPADEADAWQVEPT